MRGLSPQPYYVIIAVNVKSLYHSPTINCHIIAHAGVLQKGRQGLNNACHLNFHQRNLRIHYFQNLGWDGQTQFVRRPVGIAA